MAGSKALTNVEIHHPQLKLKLRQEGAQMHLYDIEVANQAQLPHAAKEAAEMLRSNCETLKIEQVSLYIRMQAGLPSMAWTALIQKFAELGALTIDQSFPETVMSWIPGATGTWNGRTHESQREVLALSLTGAQEAEEGSLKWLIEEAGGMESERRAAQLQQVLGNRTAALLNIFAFQEKQTAEALKRDPTSSAMALTLELRRAERRGAFAMAMARMNSFHQDEMDLGQILATMREFSS